MARGKIIAISVFVLIIVVLGILFYVYSQPSGKKLTQKQKDEAIERLYGRQANTKPDAVPVGNKAYTGKYISFQYPAKAVVYTYREKSTSGNTSSLEDFSFDIQKPKLVFNMTVVKAQDITSALDIPSVRLREQRLPEYDKKIQKIGNAQCLIYSRKNSAEITAFIVEQGRVYTISVTGSDKDEAESLFSNVLSSVSLH